MQKTYTYPKIGLEYHGMTFDSKKELDRYLMLKKMEEKGYIRNLRRRVPYELIPAHGAQGDMRAEKKVIYVADFVYINSKGHEIVEEVKTELLKKDPVYIMKRKLMRHVYGINIREKK